MFKLLTTLSVPGPKEPNDGDKRRRATTENVIQKKKLNPQLTPLCGAENVCSCSKIAAIIFFWRIQREVLLYRYHAPPKPSGSMGKSAETRGHRVWTSPCHCAAHTTEYTLQTKANPTPQNMTIQSNRPAYTPEHKSTWHYSYTNTPSIPAACAKLQTTSIGLELRKQWFQKRPKSAEGVAVFGQSVGTGEASPCVSTRNNNK